MEVLDEAADSDPTARKVPDAPSDAGSSRVRVGLWAGGAVVAAAVALAAVSFVAGDGLAALKWLVLAIFGPTVAWCASFAVSFVRQPGWYRRPPEVAWVAGLSGVVLLFVPILAYLPWAPNRIPLNSLPFGLPVLVNVGTALIFFAAISGIVLGFVSGWRRRDYGQLVFAALMAIVIGSFLLRAIDVRT